MTSLVALNRDKMIRNLLIVKLLFAHTFMNLVLRKLYYGFNGEISHITFECEYFFKTN